MQTFYMMAGLPGSGKSTVVAAFSNVSVHSSDAVRGEILGDENRQDQKNLIFQTLHSRILADLAAGKNVVYDATNISYKRRMAFLQQVKALELSNLRTVCVFLATPYEECVQCNEARERHVPADVLRRMYEKFDIPMKAEGWDEIWILGDVKDYYGTLGHLIDHLSKIGQDTPNNRYTIGRHCIETQRYLSAYYNDPGTCLFLASLLHDIGKGKTKVFYDIKGNPSEFAHYYDHERVGAYDSFCYTRGLSVDQRLMTALLIRWHMWPYVIEKSANPGRTARKIRNLLGEDIWKQVLILNDCDRHAR